MSEMIPITRQIYWSPAGGLHEILHKTTYIWLGIALGIFVYGIYQRVQLWRMGKPEACFEDPWRRIKYTLQTVLLQSRNLRSRRQRDPGGKSLYASAMHALIFYGFLGLAFGTTMVMMKEYGVFDFYSGWKYAVVTIICELGGLALLIGLILGVFRKQQNATEFKGEIKDWVLYALLAFLCIQGFAVEALRLAVQSNPPDTGWSFVGTYLSWFFPRNMDPSVAADLYSGLWYTHMLTTMGFIATVPYTKAMHIVTATLNLYTTRFEPKVMMPKLNLEDESAEYFGPRQVSDFTAKDLLSFDSCTNCRRCTDICPANAVGKVLDPRNVILKLRDAMLVENQFPKDGNKEDLYLYESGKINSDEIWACTNCGGCVNECPVGIDQMRAIVQLRRYQTLSLGEVPASAGRAIENIKQHKNPWGVGHADRFKWAEGLDVPVITGESPEVEFLYYVGCAGSYDSNNQKVARSMVKILKSAGVSFAVLGKAEQCNGEPAKRLGDEYSFSEVARSNVEQLNALRFKKIVTHCPHCFNTIKNDFKEYGGNYIVLHHTQLLSQLVKDKKLSIPNEVNKEVTFHDPCFLGRHNGEFEAPRMLLEGIAGIRLHEMEHSRETSSCCGMGGGNMWYESNGGSKTIVHNRLEHVAQTKAKTLVTGCSFCLINFKGAFKNLESTQDLEVMDIAEAVELGLDPQVTMR